jgi:signal transduction histidine kinase
VRDQATQASKDDGKFEGGSLPPAPIRTRWRGVNRWHSVIGLRLLVRVLLFSSAITLLLTLLQLYFDYRRDVGTIDRQISEIEGSYRRSLGEGLWNLDARQLELQVDGIAQLPDIRFVEVREATDRADPMVVTAGSHLANADVHREFPIFHMNRDAEQTLGVLSIEATFDDVYRRLFDRAIVILISQGAKTFAVSFFILYVVNRLITRHLVTAAKFLGGYDLRRSSPPLRLEQRPLQQVDELDQLVGGINDMCARLQTAFGELRDLSARLINAEESERARLARAMHDDVSQRLALLAIEAAVKERGLPDAAAGREALRAMRGDLARISEDVHSLSYALHPTILGDLGLAAALKAECDRFSRLEAIPVRLRVDGVPDHLPPEVALGLFRVAQEALRNIARHARARSAIVSVQYEDDALRLSVQDDGVGFDPAQPHSAPSLGHTSMRERMRLLHGELEIDGAPGHGTMVLAWAPLNKEAYHESPAGVDS